MAKPKRRWLLMTEIAKRLSMTVPALKEAMRKAGLIERDRTTYGHSGDGVMKQRYGDFPTNRAHQQGIVKNAYRGQTGRQATKKWDFDLVADAIGIPF